MAIALRNNMKFDLRKNALPSLTLFLLAYLPAAGAQTGFQTEIILKDFPIRAAIYALADWAAYDLILSSELENTPISFKGKNIDPGKVMHDLALSQNMRWVRVNGINVFASQCRMQLPAVRSGLGTLAAGSDRVSLSQQNAPASFVFRTLADRIGFGASLPEQLDGAIGIRLKGFPIQEVMDALSVAEGTQINVARNRLEISPKSGADRCSYTAKPPPPPKPPVVDAGACARKLLMPDIQSPCKLLDYLDASKLKMRGYLAVNTGKGWSACALLVDEANLAYRVCKGDHLGTNMGFVTDIDQSGLRISEIIRNVDGQWVETMRRFDLE